MPYGESFSGAKNSSRNTSPTCKGGNRRKLGSISAVVDDFDIMSSVMRPNKTYPPLIVDTNRPLTRTIAFQLLEPVARRLGEIAHSQRCVDRTQFASSGPDQIRWKALRALPVEENRTASILKASDRHRQRPSVSRHDT